jgi:hypothetical protein
MEGGKDRRKVAGPPDPIRIPANLELVLRVSASWAPLSLKALVPQIAAGLRAKSLRPQSMVAVAAPAAVQRIHAFWALRDFYCTVHINELIP